MKKLLIMFLILSNSMNVFAREYLDYGIARDAFNGIGNLPIQGLEGVWERRIAEVFCTKNNIAAGYILNGFGDGHLLEIDMTPKGNILIEDGKGGLYLKGLKTKASITDSGLLQYGFSSISGFIGSNGDKFLVVGFQSEIGWECPNLSIYSQL